MDGVPQGGDETPIKEVICVSCMHACTQLNLSNPGGKFLKNRLKLSSYTLCMPRNEKLVSFNIKVASKKSGV